MKSYSVVVHTSLDERTATNVVMRYLQSRADEVEEIVLKSKHADRYPGNPDLAWYANETGEWGIQAYFESTTSGTTVTLVALGWGLFGRFMFGFPKTHSLKQSGVVAYSAIAALREADPNLKMAGEPA
mgnify:FL=1